MVSRILTNMKMKFLIIFTVIALTSALGPLTELSIIHVNDIHARFEETSLSSSTCKEDNCIGGLARLYTVIQELRSRPNAILLNAGDNFQGTLYYNIFKWNITQYFMNLIPFDAYTLGNHEFDHKIEGLVPFMEQLNAPIVVCNIDDTDEPSIQNTYQKSIILNRDGKKIGIIGVILKSTNELADTGKLKLLDEVESINKEAERLVANEDVFTIIVLSHCGYDVDMQIARNLHEKVSLIVGGHSHSLLYLGASPNNETIEGPYPTIVKNKNNNKRVLIVQASAYTKYVGNLSVFYDENGNLDHWEGKPIFLGHNVKQDPYILEKLLPWKQNVFSIGEEILGTTLTDLTTDSCYTNECTLGDFVTDAMVSAWKDYPDKEPGAWAYATLAMTNSGSLRANIIAGNITYMDIVAAQPFESTFDCGELQGKYIKEFIEASTKPFRNTRVLNFVYIPQLSGIKVVIDLTAPLGSRIKKLEVLCQNCSKPMYEPVEDEKYYRIVVPSFVRKGGDGYTSISDNLRNIKIGPVDSDHLKRYVFSHSPFNYTKEGRITVIGGTSNMRLMKKL